jgi:thiosulfate dehydrogenase [quinone] large subunit
MVTRRLLVILRIYLAVILFLTVAGKLTRPVPFSTEMLSYLTMVAPGESSWYKAFVDNVVVPHASVFSYLVMTGEVFAAVSFLFGAATRLGGVVAMFLFANYMFSKGRDFWSPNSQDAAVFFIALILVLGAAGRSYGLDAALARRWPRVPLW